MAFADLENIIILLGHLSDSPDEVSGKDIAADLCKLNLKTNYV